MSSQSDNSYTWFKDLEVQQLSCTLEKVKTLKDLIPSYLVGSEAPFTFAESTLIYLGASRNTEKELKHHTGELVVIFSAWTARNTDL